LYELQREYTSLEPAKRELKRVDKKKADCSGLTSQMMSVKEEPDFVETHCHWTGCDREFHTQDQLVKVRNDAFAFTTKIFQHSIFIVLLTFNSLTSNFGGKNAKHCGIRPVQFWRFILGRLFYSALMASSKKSATDPTTTVLSPCFTITPKQRFRKTSRENKLSRIQFF
jgi:hypothetical protein